MADPSNDADSSLQSDWETSPDTVDQVEQASQAGGFTPGTILANRYRVVALLGKGGMGQVYRADDLRLNQPVALKFLTLHDDRARLERLYQEVRLGRQIAHPAVCRLYDVGETQGRYFLAMEYVDGEDLGALLGRIGRLPADKAVEVARDLCSGLAAVHERGVVHRDLKPANVMIDGRGRARITDFGLAIAREETAREGFAGTPGYMAPEQMEGREVDHRCDLYALGLILYEMFTGRRFFQARTLSDLLSERRQPKSPKLSSAADLLPPGVARLIDACLETDPALRPASARALLAVLPGGDPLDAAVAAGETPSPELVAGAGEIGDLSTGAAWGLLFAALAGLALLVGIADRVNVHGVAPPAKPPEVLRAEARQLLSSLGHDAPQNDWASSFSWDVGMIDFVGPREGSGDWSRLDALQPRAGRFDYRVSPVSLVAANRNVKVSLDDPPMDVPGMAAVELDDDGRLLRYRSLALEDAGGGDAAPAEPDWSVPLRAAGLDMATLQERRPTQPIPTFSDQRRSWTATYPGQPDLPVVVEAASLRERVVWFEVVLPWSTDAGAEPARPTRADAPMAQAGVLVLVLAIPFGGVMLARHNLRLGRGDRQGAVRLGLFIFCVYSLARLLNADHVARFRDELWIVLQLLAYPALFAGLGWLLYMALEPFARRLWPHSLISWRRLLGGRFSDPMVGRDVLVGCASGVALALAFWGVVLAPPLFGDPPLAPMTLVPGQALSDAREIAFRLLVNAYSGTQFALVFLFLLVLLRLLLRSQWLASALWLVLVAAPVLGEHPPAEWLIGGLRAGLLLVVLMRAGLLAAAVHFYVAFLLIESPLTLHLSAWFAAAALPQLLLIACLLVYGFRTALAGKPVLGRALDD